MQVDGEALVVLPAVNPYRVCVVLVSAVVGPGHVLHVAVGARVAILAFRVPCGDVDVGRPVRQEAAPEGRTSADRNANGVLLCHFHL